MAEGEGRKTVDYLDRLRQRRGKHWHGSCLSLQVVLGYIDLENHGIDEFICREVAPGVRVLRAKFSEITRPSINRAMATLGQVQTVLMRSNGILGLPMLPFLDIGYWVVQRH